MVKKRTKNDGSAFEKLAQEFFARIFERIGFMVLKDRRQFSGTQDGFDLLFIISEGMTTRKVFIECKDYKTDLAIGNLYFKLHDLESKYGMVYENDMAIFINPRSNFKNTWNPEASEEVLNNGKFPFKICLLEKSNQIARFFALEPDLYEAIYGTPLEFTIDEYVELRRFKGILQSKVLESIPNLTDDHKLHYLTPILSVEHPIQRGVTIIDNPETDDRQLFNVLSKETDLFGLKDAIKSILQDEVCPGLVVLGNPGMGKSVELQELALQFWGIREAQQWIPIFRKINEISEGEELKEHLPEEWKKIPQLLIILDGLDEIAFAKSFRTKLEKFINQHRGKTQIKFVISCRTNIYDNVIKDIANFKCTALNAVVFSRAIEYLVQKFGMPKDEGFYTYLRGTQPEFFENPYYLNLLGEYYTENQELPINKAGLMQRYLEKRLEYDRRNKFKTMEYDPALIVKSCKKAALTMEAMQVKYIEGERLSTLLGLEKKNFVDSSFVQKSPGKDRWEFEHRNLQEFFVAKALESLETGQILNFIRLDAKRKITHPSWLNSISFLLNILPADGEKLGNLVEWLENNDPEVLFKAERERIGKEVRIQVFQSFFRKKCKEDTLWIKAYNIDGLELVRFGDLPVNVVYLMRELANKANHRRTRISAMELVVKMNHSFVKEDLKAIFLGLLDAHLDQVDINFKGDALHRLHEMGCYQDTKFIQMVILALEGIDHPRVTVGLLRLLRDGNSEAFLPFLQSFTEIVTRKKERNYPPEGNMVSREDLTFKMVLLKLKKVPSLLFALETFIKNRDVLKVQSDDMERLVNIMIKVFNKEPQIAELVMEFTIKGLKSRRGLFRFELCISRFFKETGSEKLAFDAIYSSDVPFSASRYFLVHLVERESMEFLIKEHRAGALEKDDLFFFRNVLSHTDFEKGLEFQKLVQEETGFDFKEELLDPEIRRGWREYHKTVNQKAFDMWFDQQRLKNGTQDYFEYVGKRELEWEDLLEQQEGFWHNLELHNRFLPPVRELIDDSRRTHADKIKLEDVIENIERDLYKIAKVKTNLADQGKSGIVTSDKQKGWIGDWCTTMLAKTDFAKAFINEGNDNGLICEFLWFFRKEFNLDYPEPKLLEMLLVDYYKANGGLEGYGYIIEAVGLEKVNQQILAILMAGLPTYHITSNHMVHVLEHKLEAGFPTIREHLVDQNQERYRREGLLGPYVEATQDYGVLKEIISKEREKPFGDGIFWEALRLTVEVGEVDYSITELLAVLQIEEHKEDHIHAIKYLMRAGYPDGVKLFSEWLLKGNYYDRDSHRLFSTEDFEGVFHENLIPDIIQLIEISQTDRIKSDDFFDIIRNVYELLKVAYERADEPFYEELLSSLESCKIRLSKDEKIDLFHINSLINDANDAYNKYLSNPTTFPAIAQKIEEFKFQL